jgi:hypothetical protein
MKRRSGGDEHDDARAMNVCKVSRDERKKEREMLIIVVSGKPASTRRI